jgi:ComF family protein
VDYPSKKSFTSKPPQGPLSLKAVQDIFFPRSCIQCSGPVEDSPYLYICKNCSGFLILAHPPNCKRCGYPFLADKILSKNCPHCAELNPSYSRGYTLCLAKKTGRQLIHNLKYNNGLYVMKDLESIIQQLPHLKKICQDAILVPVPLHPTKFRERGFNQSQAFAQVLQKTLNANIQVKNILIRTRFTESQTTLSRALRKQNIRNAFALSPNIKLDFDKKYILVDDVFTTGSTANACAKVLKKAGIPTIELITFGHG